MNKATLLLFIGFITFLTQSGCQKSSAQVAPNLPPNIILFGKNIALTQPSDTGNAFIGYSFEYYLVNSDGSNYRKVPIMLPAGWNVEQGGQLTKDAGSIVFTAGKGRPTFTERAIYSCNLDGGNLKKVIDLDNSFLLQDAK